MDSRFLCAEDFDKIYFKFLADEIYEYYKGGKVHTFGAKDPDLVRMHWSREWEYPWAVLASGVRSTDSIIDLGCGGSPLPMFLDGNGCCVALQDKEDILAGDVSLRSHGKYYLASDLLYIKDLSYIGDFKDGIIGEDEEYDKAFCISVLEHVDLDIIPAFLDEVWRVLKKGGIFVITLDVNENTRQILEYVCNSKFYVAKWENEIKDISLDSLPGTYHVAGIKLFKGEGGYFRGERNSRYNRFIWEETLAFFGDST